MSGIDEKPKIELPICSCGRTETWFIADRRDWFSMCLNLREDRQVRSGKWNHFHYSKKDILRHMEYAECLTCKRAASEEEFRMIMKLFEKEG